MSVKGTHISFLNRIKRFIPDTRIFTDDLYTLAYGTDASFYRLIPKIVVKAASSDEVSRLIKCACEELIPLTFRAAGTSLSGQALSDSVLVMLTSDWRNMNIVDKGELISLQPAVIGDEANRALKPYRRKIGPDPASIKAAQIGGIAANNASGMCCGVKNNSYQTVESMKLIFADGSQLDTADPKSREEFTAGHTTLIQSLEEMSVNSIKDEDLYALIKKKYSIKNTTGYSLNALIDFEDGLDILEHLIIGSEGTLAFISEITYRTVEDPALKSVSLIIFENVDDACDAVSLLQESPVSAVEFMDKASLESAKKIFDSPTACALLVEIGSENVIELSDFESKVNETLSSVRTVEGITFERDQDKIDTLWNIRKGLFPTIGALRKKGTTVLIEDVAVPISCLAGLINDLTILFGEFHYSDAVIFGHARDGNVHFVFSQNFNNQNDIDNYEGFMLKVSKLVTNKYKGSLKAEHGTGRNMAPFVEIEWGQKATALMHKIKELFDPYGILNPGVILNADPKVHVQNLKPYPATDEIIENCIECGFCEPKCPSRDLTLTPRQRITVYREISRLRALGTDSKRLQNIENAFKYAGERTCAADGMCATACPVGIDTGKLIKKIRALETSPIKKMMASGVANNFSLVTAAARLGIKFHSRTPQAAKSISSINWPQDNADKVVYIPSCISRTMGSLLQTTSEILNKAGYSILLPKNIDSLCCGLAFESKGYPETGLLKKNELISALDEISEQRSIPILMDTSPCWAHLIENGTLGDNVYEPISFSEKFLLPRISISQSQEEIFIHPPCSSRKNGLEHKLFNLVSQLTTKSRLSPVDCCGFAGDKGFNTPELSRSALSEIKTQSKGCSSGLSTSLTCEIGMSEASGLRFDSLFELINKHSK